MSYDVKCEDLARHFLPVGTSYRTIALLAQSIQDFVEDEVRDLIEAAERPSDTEIQ